MIDYWCNGFTPEFEAAWRKGLQNSPLKIKEQLLIGFADPEDFVARMDSDGVDAVLVPSVHERAPATHIPFTDVEPQMEVIAELSRTYAGRIHGLYSIDPGDGMKGVRALEKSVRDYGFLGAHIHTHSWDKRLDDRDFYPYYAKCEELGVAVVAQVGHSAGIMPSECGLPFTLDRPAIYFQGVRFVLSHTGWPWVDDAIAMAWKHANCYIGTATHQPRFWEDSLVKFLAGRGRGKVMLGTGFPVLLHAPILAQVDDLPLSDEARHALVHGAAAEAFDLKV